MFLSNITNMLIGTVNTAVLSGYSEEAVAATGTVNTLINLLNLLLGAISTGTSVVISNFIGGEHLPKATKTGFVSISICGLLGVLISVVLLPFSRPIIQWMNLEGAVLEQGILYFRIRVAAMIIPAVSGGFSSIMHCYGYPKHTITAGLISIFCNLLLNIYVIQFPEYAPVTGVAGIAWGGVISQMISFLIILFFFCKVKIKLQRPQGLTEYRNLLGRILKIGLPSALSSGSFTLSQVITTSFIATLGAFAVSAKVYYTNILCYAYLFSINLGNANSLLIGRLTGAGRYEHAKKLNATLVRITTIVNLLISLGIVLLRFPLLKLFTDNGAIIDLALGIFLVDIITEQARAVSQIYEYALRAAGDVAFTMVVVTISCWCCSVGLAYILSIPLRLGLIGIWIGLALHEAIRAIATFFRWRSNKWVGMLKP